VEIAAHARHSLPSASDLEPPRTSVSCSYWERPEAFVYRLDQALAKLRVPYHVDVRRSSGGHLMTVVTVRSVDREAMISAVDAAGGSAST
jgi:hypothetical protein